MPNWCSNQLILQHADAAMLDKAAAALRAGNFLKTFVPVPADLHITAGYLGDPEAQQELERKTAANVEAHGFGNWYDFCCSRWGTKWDVEGEPSLHDGVLTVCFDSAWAPPCAAYEAMAEQGFEIAAYFWEPGMGFAGSWVDGIEETYEVGNIKDALDLPDDIERAFGIVETMEEWEREEA